MPTKIQLRRDSYINFGSAQVTADTTPILASGEPAWDSGTILKIGDGATLYQKLPSFQPVMFSVLTSNSSLTTGTNTKAIFGSSVILYQSVVYEIDMQVVGQFVTSGSNAITVSIGNTFAGTATNSRFIVDWTCHRTTYNTSTYIASGSTYAQDNTPTKQLNQEVGTDWSALVEILPTGSTLGTYYFTYRVKGIMINSADGSTDTLNPKIVFSNGNWSSATLGAGSYIKITALGQKNAVVRSGNWTDVSGGSGGGGYPVMV
jgi:hypothetical protein